MSFLDQLNPQQREAVETTEGPVLILAGAGSGKTRVITYRIAYLIEHMGVMPESILAMTFTNKAAAEMGERVEKLVGGLSIAKPVISTFHSFCVRVLRRDIEALQIPSATPGQPPIGHTKKFVIYDESDQQSVVKSMMKRLGLDDKQLTPRTVLSRISWAKNHMLDPQELYLQSADPKTEKIAHLFEEYRKELRKANALDFDDLLLEATRLLKTAAPVREYYNRRFQYLLIDEYQDTNRPQYELMRMLAGERGITFARWAMRISRFIPGAGPTSATFSSSKKIFPRRRLFVWNRTTAPRRIFCRRRRRWWRIIFGAKARIFGPRGRAERRSATTRLRTARTKRSLPPTTLRNICARRRDSVAKLRAPRCSTGPIPSRGCLKKPCGGMGSNIKWSADFLSTSGLRSKT